MDAALVAARLVHEAGTLVLAGLALTGRYLLAALPAPQRAAVLGRLRPVLAAAALASGLGTVLWLLAVAASLGEGWRDALDPTFLASVLDGTAFGAVWRWHLLLAVLLVPLALRARPSGLPLAAASTLQAVSTALVGHNVIEEGPAGTLHRLGDVVHLLAAAVWLGGLVLLALSLTQPGAGGVVRRFTRLGYAAVLLVALSGLVHAWFLLGRPERLVTSAYGRVLLAKLVLVGLLTGLALLNRLRVAPGFRHRPERTRRTMTRTVALQLAAGLLILAATALLGTLPPGTGTAP